MSDLALPRSLQYQSKIEAAPSRQSRVSIAPMNGTGNYYKNDTVTINLPTRPGLVLSPTDSYLKFKLNITAAAAATVARFDSCGAHGLIERVSVYSAGNMLENTTAYGMLAKMLFDIQVPTDSTYGKYNVTSGTRSDLIVNTGVANAIVQGLQINAGDRLAAYPALPSASSVFGTTATDVDYYCLNLISMVGSLGAGGQMVPLFGLTSSPLSIQIQLVDDPAKAICSSGVISSFYLSEVEFVASFIELGDDAMSTINRSLNNGPLQYVIPQYRNYVGGGTYTGSTSIMMPIACKVASLKSIFCTFRDKVPGTATYFPYSSVNTTLKSYQFRLGPFYHPAKAPDNYSEMFCEVCKAISNLSNLDHQPSIDKFAYNMAASTANNDTATTWGNVNSGSFYVGLDCETYTGASKESIFAGYNSFNDDIFFNPVFTNIPTNTPLRIDAFCLYDAIISCENGTGYLSF